jgi:hypothetical protein
MSTRERWIVYPLLFLTLGIALRDKVVPPVHRIVFSQEIRAGNIRCSGIEAKEMELRGATVPLRLTLPGEEDGGGKTKSPD